MGHSIESVTFEVSAWHDVERDAEHRVWSNDAGDVLTLLYFADPDPPPVDMGRVSHVRDFTRAIAVARGAGLIEASPARCGDVVMMRSVVKHPQVPTGFTFVASLSFHAGGAGYSLNIECPETGVTGARETAVALELGVDRSPGFFKRLMGGGEPWQADPYDASQKGPVMRCLADDARWDPMFPDHPLSRARRHLACVESSLSIG